MNYNYRVYKFILLICVCASLLTACGSPSNIATPTLFIITSTLPPSAPPPPTSTPPPPAPTSTPVPIEGTTSTQLNVRGEPSTASSPLGLIAPSAKVQIIGKDPSGNWYQVLFAQSPDGKGWVTAQYVQVENKDAIPIMGGASASGSSGVIVQQVNVRSGPGTEFDSLGTLNAKDVVTLTGKDSDGAWLQIEFKNGADGKGWLAAAYVQASGIENLPIVAQSGDVVGTATPTMIPATITPTLVPAIQDGDSAQSPAVNVTFSPSGTSSLIYSSDVSAPNGDAEDWIAFTPYTSSVMVSLTCVGNGELKVELLQNSAPLRNWNGLNCGETQQLDLSKGQTYLVHLSASSAQGGLAYVHYTISIETIR